MFNPFFALGNQVEGLNWLESFCALNEKLNPRDFPRRIIGNSWASGRQAGELSWQAGNNFNLISWSLCILHVQYIHGVFTILFGSLLNCKITCYDEKQPRITIRYHTSYTKKLVFFHNSFYGFYLFFILAWQPDCLLFLVLLHKQSISLETIRQLTIPNSFPFPVQSKVGLWVREKFVRKGLLPRAKLPLLI